MPRTQVNPDYKPEWTLDSQNEFLKWAYNFYCKKVGDPRPHSWYNWKLGRYENYIPPRTPHGGWLSELYLYGLCYYHIKMSYSEFCGAILYGQHPYPAYEYRGSWYYRSRRPYRHQNGYRRKPHHQKKERDTNREDWRKRKGFDRDHAKYRGRHFSKRTWKKIAMKEHRQFERQMIESGQYSELGGNTLLIFQDPWRYD